MKEIFQLPFGLTTWEHTCSKPGTGLRLPADPSRRERRNEASTALLESRLECVGDCSGRVVQLRRDCKHGKQDFLQTASCSRSVAGRGTEQHMPRRPEPRRLREAEGNPRARLGYPSYGFLPARSCWNSIRLWQFARASSRLMTPFWSHSLIDVSIVCIPNFAEVCITE